MYSSLPYLMWQCLEALSERNWALLIILFVQGGVGLVLFGVFLLHQFASVFMGALKKHWQVYNNLLYSQDELFIWQEQLIYNTQSTKNVLFKVATILNSKMKCQRTIWYKLQRKKPNTYSQGKVIDYFFFLNHKIQIKERYFPFQVLSLIQNIGADIFPIT